jgi:hypothetical protein
LYADVVAPVIVIGIPTVSPAVFAVLYVTAVPEPEIALIKYCPVVAVADDVVPVAVLVTVKLVFAIKERTV